MLWISVSVKRTLNGKLGDLSFFTLPLKSEERIEECSESVQEGVIYKVYEFDFVDSGIGFTKRPLGSVLW